MDGMILAYSPLKVFAAVATRQRPSTRSAKGWELRAHPTPCVCRKPCLKTAFATSWMSAHTAALRASSRSRSQLPITSRCRRATFLTILQTRTSAHGPWNSRRLCISTAPTSVRPIQKITSAWLRERRCGCCTPTTLLARKLRRGTALSPVRTSPALTASASSFPPSLDVFNCFMSALTLTSCVAELVCEFDINSLKEKPPKGKIGWVSDAAVPCTVNLYSQLFNQCEIESVRTDAATRVR